MMELNVFSEKYTYLILFQQFQEHSKQDSVGRLIHSCFREELPKNIQDLLLELRQK